MNSDPKKAVHIASQPLFFGKVLRWRTKSESDYCHHYMKCRSKRICVFTISRTYCATHGPASPPKCDSLNRSLVRFTACAVWLTRFNNSSGYSGFSFLRYSFTCFASAVISLGHSSKGNFDRKNALRNPSRHVYPSVTVLSYFSSAPPSLLVGGVKSAQNG